jgi:hypothetical protein
MPFDISLRRGEIGGIASQLKPIQRMTLTPADQTRAEFSLPATQGGFGVFPSRKTGESHNLLKTKTKKIVMHKWDLSHRGMKKFKEL